MGDLKSQISSSFKLSGLTVRLEACKYLVSLLQPVDPDDRQSWIDKIIDKVQTGNLKTNVIDKETVCEAVKECTDHESGRYRLLIGQPKQILISDWTTQTNTIF